MLTLHLTPAQMKALEGATGDGQVIAQARTLHALAAKKLIDPVMGWYQKSVSRRVGRYFATETLWGVTSFRINDEGRKALAAEQARHQVGAAEWKRTEPGHYEMTDNGIAVVKVFREPGRRASGMAGPDEWTAFIYPEGCDRWCFIRRGHKTLARAKAAAETAYRAALADIAAGRPTEQ